MLRCRDLRLLTKTQINQLGESEEMLVFCWSTNKLKALKYNASDISYINLQWKCRLQVLHSKFGTQRTVNTLALFWLFSPGIEHEQVLSQLWRGHVTFAAVWHSVTRNIKENLTRMLSRLCRL